MKRRSGGNYTVAVLYTVIYRLQELGFVEISSVEVVDGRARSSYRITAAGEAYLVRSLVEYDELSVAFAKLTEGIRPG